MCTIITGVIIVGIAFMLYKKDDKEYSTFDVIIGLILLQIGQLFGALAYVAEEKFLGDCDDLDPMLVVGYEGVASFCLWLVLLPIFQFIPCSIDSICTNGVIEDTYGTF